MSLYTQAGSPFWYCEFMVNTKTIRRSTKIPHEGRKANRRKAEKVEEDERRSAKAEAAAGHSDGMILSDAFKRYAETVISDGSSDGSKFAERAKIICDKFGHDRAIDTISEKEVHDWRDGLKVSGKRVSMKGGPSGVKVVTRGGLKTSSINGYLSSLKAVLSAAHEEWKCLHKLPNIKKLRDKMGNKKKRKTRFFSDDEEARLLEVSHEYLRYLWRFLLWTGARKMEAVTLRWANVRLTGNRRATVNFAHDPDNGNRTKSGEDREVPLTDAIRDMLFEMKAWQTKAGYTEDRVFAYRNTAGDIVPYRNPGTSLKDAIRAAKITKASIHTTRHTYASRLVMSGVSLTFVAKLLGHSDTQVTALYGHLVPEVLDGPVAILEKWNGPPTEYRQQRA